MNTNLAELKVTFKAKDIVKEVDTISEYINALEEFVEICSTIPLDEIAQGNSILRLGKARSKFYGED